jgi:hypothetical protein
MQKLRTLVEERSVIFVAFEDEVFAVAEPEAATKVFGDASDQEGRLQTCGLEDPSKHRGCRRLAVGTGHYEHVFADEELIVQNLWQRTERNALVENQFEFDVAARERVANNNQIRPRIQVRLGKGLGKGDSERLKES